jgi:hypothetical protein
VRARSELGLEVQVVELLHGGRHAGLVPGEEAGDELEGMVGRERDGQQVALRRQAGDLGRADVQVLDRPAPHAGVGQRPPSRAVGRGQEGVRRTDGLGAVAGQRVVDRVLRGGLDGAQRRRHGPARLRRGGRGGLRARGPGVLLVVPAAPREGGEAEEDGDPGRGGHGAELSPRDHRPSG